MVFFSAIANLDDGETDRDALDLDIPVAGSSAGLRIPGGPPLFAPLDPDKPSVIFDGATPNEAAASALPYLRFMSDLMNPSATASALFNKGHKSNDESETDAKRQKGDVDANTDEKAGRSREQDETRQMAKDAKRVGAKRVNEIAQQAGYDDAEDLKREFGYGSETDLFIDRDGNLYAGPRKGVGAMEDLHVKVEK